MNARPLLVELRIQEDCLRLFRFGEVLKAELWRIALISRDAGQESQGQGRACHRCAGHHSQLEIRALLSVFGTQRAKDWFSEETFLTDAATWNGVSRV